ncbi:MAG: hypothetical protein ACRCYT_02535 [Cetobacterium sp.]
MFFITSIIIAALFLISVSMPFLSWTLPFYKIKKLENSNLKNKILINILVIAIIGWIDIKFLITYFGVFVPIEILYYIFKKYGNKIKEFDKIFITSLSIGLLISIYLYFNRVGFNLGFENLKNIYLKKTTFTISEVNAAFDYIKNNLTYLVFSYLSVTVFLTYYFLDKEKFLEWEVSYLWLIPYILLFFIQKYTSLSGVFLQNMLEVLKIVYSLYFVKIVTGILNEKVKKQSLSFIVAVFLALISPEFAFIFGGLACGFRIKIVKSNR